MVLKYLQIYYFKVEIYFIMNKNGDDANIPDLEWGPRWVQINSYFKIYKIILLRNPIN